jgi:hypothetical protein
LPCISLKVSNGFSSRRKSAGKSNLTSVPVSEDLHGGQAKQFECDLLARPSRKGLIEKWISKRRIYGESDDFGRSSKNSRSPIHRDSRLEMV